MQLDTLLVVLEPGILSLEVEHLAIAAVEVATVEVVVVFAREQRVDVSSLPDHHPSPSPCVRVQETLGLEHEVHDLEHRGNYSETNPSHYPR